MPSLVQQKIKWNFSFEQTAIRKALAQQMSAAMLPPFPMWKFHKRKALRLEKILLPPNMAVAWG